MHWLTSRFLTQISTWIKSSNGIDFTKEGSYEDEDAKFTHRGPWSKESPMTVKSDMYLHPSIRYYPLIPSSLIVCSVKSKPISTPEEGTGSEVHLIVSAKSRTVISLLCWVYRMICVPGSFSWTNTVQNVWTLHRARSSRDFGVRRRWILSSEFR